ncbi:MAG: tandem-95 repeat protein [Saccharospirillaceae bacterium]|nr:tandem-95 repeat protein [Saccharospirillaceae bacterium]
MRNVYSVLASLLLFIFSSLSYAAFTEPNNNKIIITFGSGFSDATVVVNTGGNYHSTLGEQRKEVIKRAALIWSEQLDLVSDIYITANFSSLYCVSNSATLGSAGPSYVYNLSNIWYPSALARQIATPDSIAVHEDISINLNSNLDLGCFSGSPNGWYYGLDNNPDAGTENLLSVVVHEFAHGLGFLTFTDANTGAWFNSYPDAYSQYLYDNNANKAWTAMTNAERYASGINDNLAWNGSNTNTYAAGVLNAGFSNSRTEIFSPNPYQQGSSLAHFDTDASPNQVMEPYATVDGVNIDIEPNLMKDIGWTLNTDSAQPTLSVYDRTLNIDKNTSVLLTPLFASSSTVSSGSIYVYEFSQLPTNGALDDVYSDSPTYTPSTNYIGTDVVKFKVYDDNFNLSLEGSFNIVIAEPVVDADPVAVNDSYSFAEDANPQNLSVLSNDSDDNSLNTASIVITSVFSAGSIVVSGSDIVLTPTNNVNGNFSFTYTVDDNIGQTSNSATVSINISAVNDAPVAMADSFNLDEDHIGLTLDLIGNDIDVDNTLDNDNVIILSNPSSGTLNYSATVFSYVPNVNYSGSDSFTYKLNDSIADSSTVSVTLTINEVNDAPYSIADGFTLNQNTTMDLYVLANDSDQENTVDYSMINIVNDVSNGTLTLTGLMLSYTPNNNFFGDDDFTYYLNDTTDNGNTVTVNLSITHVNEIPYAQNDSFNVDEDTVTILDVLANDSDDVLIDSLTLLTQPVNGDLIVNNDHTLTYTPNLNYYGNDSFTYLITDDENSDSTISSVGINVVSVNDSPIANEDSFTIGTQSVYLFPLLNDTDEDINSVIITIDTQPINGTLDVSGNNVVYVANLNYIGLDSFTYYLTDSSNDSSASVLVELDIRAQSTPITHDLTFSFVEDSTDNNLNLITVNSSQNSIAEIVVVSQVMYGQLNVSGLNVTYTPNDNFSGNDNFNYQLKDSENLLSNVSNVVITMTPINDSPVALNDWASVTIGNSKIINVLNNDIDEDINNLNIIIIDEPQYGSVLVENNTIVYMADIQHSSNMDEFSYQITDSAMLTSNTAVVAMNITLQASTPVTYNDFYSVASNTILNFYPTIDDDYYTDVVSINLIQVENGSASVDGLIVTFEADSNFAGVATIIYSLTDELNQTSNEATISINVLANNLVSVEQQKIVLMDVDLIFNAYDHTQANTNALISILNFPNKGYLNIIEDNLVYEPFNSQTGADEFTYLLTTDNNNQIQVNVIIELLNEEDYVQYLSTVVITLGHDHFTVIEDKELLLNVLFNDNLINNNLYEVNIVQSSIKGSVVISGQSVLYSPNSNATGVDYFIYQVTNINNQQISKPTRVDLTISAVNDAPTSEDFSLSTSNSVTLDLFSHAVDVDGTLTSINIVSAPSNGLLILSGNQATYSKVSGFSGNDSFTYTITDDQNMPSDVIQVSIEVKNSVSSNNDEVVNIQVSGGSFNIYELLILFLLMLSILIIRKQTEISTNLQKVYINISK